MRDRIFELRKLMKERGFDALLVSSPENHLYFSKFANPDGRLLICRDCAVAFEDFRYIEAAKKAIDNNVFTVVMPENRNKGWLKDAVLAANVKIIAYEDEFLTCRELETLKNEVPMAEFVPCRDLVDVLRICKEETEVECVVKAQRIAEKSFEELLPEIKPDCTEIYLASLLEFIMRKNGSEGASFETIAVSGKNSSSPHGVPRNVKIEKGFMTFDFGAMIGGYHSDMTRTIVIGKADSEMKRLYDTVLKAQTAVLDVIKEGDSCFAMDKIARDIIDGAGYKGAFGHSLGHGVGLQIHELPNMGPASGDVKLAAGHIVTVEPGIYLEGKYGCRIEDMVYITPGGSRNLTELRKDMIEI